MSEKRKPTTRYRGEPPPKRRQFSPPPPVSVTSKERPKQLDQALPTKLKDGQSLPTQPEKQESNLPHAGYQSISESGVLAASIQQSRQRWTADGIFDRYWAKPSKKKGQIDSQNPAKETMARLGVCSMVIEPHIFDTTLYTVREPQTVFMPSKLPLPPPPPPPNPQYNPFQDHKTYAPQPHSPYSQKNQSQHHFQPSSSSSSSLTLPPFREGFGHFSPSGPPSYQSRAAPPKPATEPPRPPQRSDRNNIQSNENPNDADKPTDPVIQMLATRAASDHNLKALMKVVASGHASQEQLRSFQNHIDELNELIKSRKSPTQGIFEQDTKPTDPLPTNTNPFPSSSPSTKTNFGPSISKSSPLAYTTPTHPPAAAKAEPHALYFSHAAGHSAKPKYSTPFKADISAIVFDFGGGGDRFSFPKFSILEYLFGGTQVIASFLIIHKGNSIKSAGYKDSLSYYQPITIRLSSQNPRTLEQLARVVAPPDEVRKYMNGIFDKMNPAKRSFLVTRLPRPKEENELEKPESSAPAQPNIIKPFYAPPSFLSPLTV